MSIYADIRQRRFSDIVLQILDWPRSVKRSLLFVSDLIVSIMCLLLAIGVRYGNFNMHPSVWIMLLISGMPVTMLLARGFHNGISRVFHEEVMRAVLTTMLINIFISEILIYLGVFHAVPRAAPVIHAFLLFVWLWNSRLSIKQIIKKLINSPQNKVIDKERTVIYGVGQSAKDLYYILKKSSRYEFVGFVDNNPQVIGGRVMGLRVYTDHNLAQFVTQMEVNHIFIALNANSTQIQKNIVEILKDAPIKISSIPSLNQIADGKVKVTDIKTVDVLDVLNRDTVTPDEQLLIKNISGKVVLVTGAGGSIGSELCRQIMSCIPSKLILFELSEFALYTIQSELAAIDVRKINSKVEIIGYLGNVMNQGLLESIMNKHQVQTVYHAAAYKHVPIVEENPFEGVRNNFVGTWCCASAAVNAQAETFVLISTDKAVRPTNIMGATKRMAELACQAIAKRTPKTTISMVRFGNVLGSSGSVVPLFNAQINAGGPLTVTHPDVTRYFMTIPEAAQLVIQAGAMAKGGEVFVLDMGEPVKIADLAKRMIRLSGHKLKEAEEQEGIEIQYIGLRPGEKLYEELIISGDNIADTSHPLIMQATEKSYSEQEIEQFINQIISMTASDSDIDWLKGNFAYFVDGYCIATQKNLKHS